MENELQTSNKSLNSLATVGTAVLNQPPESRPYQLGLVGKRGKLIARGRHVDYEEGLATLNLGISTQTKRSGKELRSISLVRVLFAIILGVIFTLLAITLILTEQYLLCVVLVLVALVLLLGYVKEAKGMVDSLIGRI